MDIRSPLLVVPAALMVLLGVPCAFVWVRSRIRYVIGRSSLRVVLFGQTLRRIPFADIERVGKPKREAGWFQTESWRNTGDDDHRALIIHRKSGWRRRVLITPRHRYAFRGELREALAQSTGTELEGDVESEEMVDADRQE
jgi:hypothetical protein